MKSNSINIPDFAFPKKVSENSEKALNQALADNEPVKALRQLMNWSIAQLLISNEKFPEITKRVDSIASVLPSPYKGIGYLFEAQLYHDFYNNDRWTYDRRTVDAGMKDENPEFWSKNFFAEKVSSLTQKALDERNEASSLPLGDIKILVDSIFGIDTYKIYDFTVYKTINLRNTFSGNSIIPFFKVTPESDYNPEALIDQLIDLHPQPSPSLITALIKKSEYITDDSEQLAFLREKIEDLRDYTDFYIDPLLNIYASKLMAADDYQGLRWLSEYLKYKTTLTKSPTNFIVSLLKDISTPSVQLEFPNVVITNWETPVNITASNTKEFYLLVLDAKHIKDSWRIKLDDLKRKTSVINRLKITHDDTIPFRVEISKKLNVANPGDYALIVSESENIDDIITNNPDYVNPLFFKASDIDILSIEGYRENGVTTPHKDALHQGCLVVDSKSGGPVEGASVTFEEWEYKKGVRVLTKQENKKTDNRGLASTSLRAPLINANYKGSTAESHTSVITHRDDFSYSIRFFCDRQIYRPGDKVNFMGILFSSSSHEAQICKDEEIAISLKDANFQTIDTLRLTTDSSGRVFGEFLIPQEGLLGRWVLSTKHGSYYFNVEEYKTPSFIVNLEKEKATGDSIVFKGNVATYSGMPLAETEVTFDVNFEPFRFFFYRGSGGSSSYSSKVMTDREGNFTISLPVANLPKEYYRGLFTIKATATDIAGETNSSTLLPFFLENNYQIPQAIPSKILIEGENVEIKVPVYDALNLHAQISVDYQLINHNKDNEVMLEGTFESPNLSLPSSAIASGIYELKLKPATPESEWQSFKVTFFRNDDKYAPEGCKLWLPYTSSSIYTKGGVTKIKVGSDLKNHYIMCTVADTDGIESIEWLEVNNSIIEYEVEAPGNKQRKKITFYLYENHCLHTAQLELIPQVQTETLEITTKTFRSSLEPGQPEKWSFELTYGGKPIKGFAYALLYDKAMDALAPLRWDTQLFSPYYYVPDLVNGVSSHYTGQQFKGEYIRTNPLFNASPAFAFDFYGYFPLSSVRFMAAYDYAPVARAAVMSSKKSESITNEEITACQADYSAGAAEYALEEEGSIVTETDDIQKDEEIAYRESECPVAFFKPDLTSTNEGALSLEFVTPNFNTTWKLVLGAYTPELATDAIHLEAVASKKVMVQMNPPRFLRTGDSAVIAASVMNNSEETVLVSGEFEIFDVITGKILQTMPFSGLELSPLGSKPVTVNFDCPDNLNSFGLRVYARCGGYSDGEETVVPVLPSSQPVVESETFYLAPGMQSFAFSIPSYRDGATVTFKYCDNPVWEVLTALPALITPESDGVIDYSYAFFSNCMATGILNRHPSLKAGLEMIVKGEAGDSLLVSNLKKDENLKIVSLNNTPWVNNAASEDLRLSSLSAFLDSGSAEEAVSKAWKDLLSLQNTDGGWSWFKDMPSSRWMTQSVVHGIGKLYKYGYLPDKAEYLAAARKGIDYWISDFLKDVKQFNLNPWDYNRTVAGFLYILSFYPDNKINRAFESYRNSAISYLEGNWSKFDIGEKADAAITLWRNGKKKTARSILESLKEYSSSSPDKGTWFDNLSSDYLGSEKTVVTARVLLAFNEISPDDTIIDGLRQWLLLQRQAQEWQDRLWSLETIDALLTCGSPWTSDYRAPEIMIGGEKIEAAEISNLTGHCTINVGPESFGKEIVITRHNDGPAWGGVISQAIKPILEVKAHEIPDLKITKQYWKLAADSTAAKEAVAGDVFKVGDLVRVTLILDCGRDLDYVALNDWRPALLEPVDNRSGYGVDDGLWRYMEIRNSATNLYYSFMPRGRHIISYDCHVMEEGVFSVGIATIQSLYYPLITAHSAGMKLTGTPTK